MFSDSEDWANPYGGSTLRNCRFYVEIYNCSTATPLLIAEIASLYACLVGWFFGVFTIIYSRYRQTSGQHTGKWTFVQQITLLLAIFQFLRIVYSVLQLGSLFQPIIATHVIQGTLWVIILIIYMIYVMNVMISYPTRHLTPFEVSARARRIRILCYSGIFVTFIIQVALSTGAGAAFLQRQYSTELAFLRTAFLFYSLVLFPVVVLMWHYGRRLELLATRRSNAMNQFLMLSPKNTYYCGHGKQIETACEGIMNTHTRLEISRKRMITMNRYFIPSATGFLVLFVFVSIALPIVVRTPWLDATVGIFIYTFGPMMFAAAQVSISYSLYRQLRQENTLFNNCTRKIESSNPTSESGSSSHGVPEIYSLASLSVYIKDYVQPSDMNQESNSPFNVCHSHDNDKSRLAR